MTKPPKPPTDATRCDRANAVVKIFALGGLWCLTPFLVMLGLWLLFWWPVLLGERQLYIRDLTYYAVPMKTFMMSRFHAGAFPFWFPQVSTGVPFFAEPTHQVLYPFNLLFWVTPTIQHGISWFILLHLLLGQFAFFGLGRVLGFSRALALWGALLYGYAGYTLSITDNINYLPAVLWVPLALACFIRGLQTGAFRFSALTALAVTAMLLAGDTFNPLFLGLFCALLLLCRWRLPAWLPGASAQFAVAHGVLSFGLAGLLAAVQLLPTAELLRLSVRSKPLDFDEITLWSFPPQRLIEFIQPYFYGSKYPSPHFIGQFMYPQFREPWADSIYLGLLPVLAAAWAVLTRFRTALFWVLLVAVALLLGFGHFAPYDFHQLMAWFPPISYQRYLEKLVFWVTVAMPVLAMLGMDAFWSQREQLTARFQAKTLTARLFWMALAVVLGTIILLKIPTDLWIWPHAREVSEEWRGHDVLRGPHVLFLYAHCLLLLIPLLLLPWLKGAWQRRYMIALMGVAVLDLMVIHAGQVPTELTSLLVTRPLPQAYQMIAADHPGPHVRVFYDDKADYDDEQNEPITLNRLAQAYHQPGLRDNFPYYWAYRFLYSQSRLLFNYGVLYGIGYQNGRFEPLQQQRHKLMDDVLAANQPELLAALHAAPYVITSDHPAMPVWKPKDFITIGRNPAFNLRVLKARHAVPRAYIAPNAIYNTEPGKVFKILTAPFLSHDYRQQVEIAAQPPKSPTPTALVPLNAQAMVSLLRDEPEEILISAHSPYAGGYLVLTESLFPGWQAWVDGRPAPVYLANQRFMAVPLSSGVHRVTFRYHSTWFPVGLALSILGLLIATGLLLLPLSRKAERESGS